jgi:hypothetical protein
MREDRLIFLHIPKTAGSTLKKILVRNYRYAHSLFGYEFAAHRELFLRRFWDGSDKRLYLDHIRWSDLGEERVSRARVLTMLRDPVERAVSMYVYCRTHADNPLHEIITSQGMSLEAFIMSPHFASRANFQTAFLTSAGAADPLASAKANLMSENVVFGVTERFDESVLLFAKDLGLRNVHYTRENVSRKRPSSTAMPDALRERIVELGQSDMALYAWAWGVLESRLAAQGETFREKVKSFRGEVARLQERKAAHAMRRAGVA